MTSCNAGVSGKAASNDIQTGGGAVVRPASPHELRVLDDQFSYRLSKPDVYLPFNRSAAAGEPHKSTRTTKRRVDGSLLEKLRSLADHEHVTLFEVLFGAYQALLHRYTGSPEMVTPALASSHPTTRTSILLRTDVSGDPAFRELLVQVRENLREPSAHNGDGPAFPVMFQVRRAVSRWPKHGIRFKANSI